MKKMILSGLIGVLALVACEKAKATVPMLTETWVIDSFDAPESVAYHPNSNQIFVSNVNGDGSTKDGNGYISIISPDGKRLQGKWLDGLDAPKGMEVDGDTLYVSDIDRLLVIDIPSASIRKTIQLDGAKFANDVTVWDGNGVFVSDSQTNRIYHYKDGEASIWLQNDKLAGVNGLLVHEGALLAVTMTEGALLSVNLETREIETIATGFKNADMMTPIGQDEYIISSWPGVLHYLDAEGKISQLANTEEVSIFMNDFIRLDDQLIVPNWLPGSVRAYRIQR